MTKLTPEHFDSLTRSHAPAREDRIIWTAKAIGRRIGCSEDYVRKTLANYDNSPVRRIGRRFYVMESELLRWMYSTR